MRLRELELRDADGMLMWMHDPTVVDKLQTNFANKSIEDCRAFIDNSISSDSIHLAIADDSDEYMGTVSLKHICDKHAEFAITVCKEAMGKGYSLWAMKEIINKGFTEYGLEKIYWCVAPDNLRAVRFYDKNRFDRVEISAIEGMTVGYTHEQIERYIWYMIGH